MRRLLILVAVSLVFAACTTTTESDEDSTTTSSTSIPDPPDPTDAEPVGASDTTEGEETTTTAGQGDLGSRTNPIPLGEPAQVGENYEATVITFEPDATAEILAFNEFNEPPPDGSVFSLIRLSLTYVGDSSGDPWLDLSWSGVGASNVGVTGDDCTTYPENMFDIGELFTGGTAEANVCLTVPSSDVETIVLILEESFSFEESRVFFALH